MSATGGARRKGQERRKEIDCATLLERRRSVNSAFLPWKAFAAFVE